VIRFLCDLLNVIGGGFPVIHRLDLLDMLEIGEFCHSSAFDLSLETMRLTIGFGVFELPSRNLVLKQNVNFAKCTILLMSLMTIPRSEVTDLGLGKPEPTPDK
jgi:hypothetical protein